MFIKIPYKGYISVSTYNRGDDCYVDYVTIYPKYRGQGYSHLLLNKLTDWADENHIRLTLHVDCNCSGPLNTKCLKRLYFQHGFRVIKVNLKYYFVHLKTN